jgi:hypothetical protein
MICMVRQRCCHCGAHGSQVHAVDRQYHVFPQYGPEFTVEQFCGNRRLGYLTLIPGTSLDEYSPLPRLIAHRALFIHSIWSIESR